MKRTKMLSLGTCIQIPPNVRQSVFLASNRPSMREFMKPNTIHPTTGQRTKFPLVFSASMRPWPFLAQQASTPRLTASMLWIPCLAPGRAARRGRREGRGRSTNRRRRRPPRAPTRGCSTRLSGPESPSASESCCCQLLSNLWLRGCHLGHIHIGHIGLTLLIIDKLTFFSLLKRKLGQC